MEEIAELGRIAAVRTVRRLPDQEYRIATATLEPVVRTHSRMTGQWAFAVSF